MIAAAMGSLSYFGVAEGEKLDTRSRRPSGRSTPTSTR